MRKTATKSGKCKVCMPNGGARFELTAGAVYGDLYWVCQNCRTANKFVKRKQATEDDKKNLEAMKAQMEKGK